MLALWALLQWCHKVSFSRSKTNDFYSAHICQFTNSILQTCLQMLTLENYKYLFLLHPKDKAFCCFTINGSEKRELTHSWHHKNHVPVWVLWKITPCTLWAQTIMGNVICAPLPNSVIKDELCYVTTTVLQHHKFKQISC